MVNISGSSVTVSTKGSTTLQQVVYSESIILFQGIGDSSLEVVGSINGRPGNLTGLGGNMTVEFSSGFGIGPELTGSSGRSPMR
jgi:hypothetical protein